MKKAPYAAARRAAALFVLVLVPGSVSAALVAGCVVESAAGGPASVPVTGPPPEPMNEARPVPAPPRVLWIPGYWHWTGIQYAWIPGHWEEPPPGQRWRVPRYLLRDGVYYYEPGGWLGPRR
jgi:hypothetical protein